MHLESGILGKLGLAVGALEGPQARVRPLVQQQGALGAERLSAVGADVLQGAAFVDLPCGGDTGGSVNRRDVNGHVKAAHLSLVTDDVLLPFEGLLAAIAGEEPLGAVDVLLVDLQVALVGEGLLAGQTAINDVCLDSVVGAAAGTPGDTGS